MAGKKTEAEAVEEEEKKVPIEQGDLVPHSAQQPLMKTALVPCWIHH